jgi:hypothetical protein
MAIAKKVLVHHNKLFFLKDITRTVIVENSQFIPDKDIVLLSFIKLKVPFQG